MSYLSPRSTPEHRREFPIDPPKNPLHESAYTLADVDPMVPFVAIRGIAVVTWGVFKERTPRDPSEDFWGDVPVLLGGEDGAHDTLSPYEIGLVCDASGRWEPGAAVVHPSMYDTVRAELSPTA